MIEELCIAGACQRGICYIGSLEKLEELKLLEFKKLKKLIGVSMGSFIALAYLIGYTKNELLEIVMDTDTSSFKDIELINNGLAVLKGYMFRKWVWDSINQKIDPNTTFSELYEITNIDFSVLSTCIEDGMVIFSHINTPDESIYNAVIASMNFPFVFPPFVINGKRYVDGGVLNNFPMEMLGPDALGLRVSHKSVDNIESIFEYIGKLFELIVHHIKKLSPPNSENLVVIDASDFSLIDFDMTVDDKITLYRRGYDTISESPIIKRMVEKMNQEVIKDEKDDNEKIGEKDVDEKVVDEKEDEKEDDEIENEDDEIENENVVKLSRSKTI